MDLDRFQLNQFDLSFQNSIKLSKSKDISNLKWHPKDISLLLNLNRSTRFLQLRIGKL